MLVGTGWKSVNHIKSENFPGSSFSDRWHSLSIISTNPSCRPAPAPAPVLPGYWLQGESITQTGSLWAGVTEKIEFIFHQYSFYAENPPRGWVGKQKTLWDLQPESEKLDRWQFNFP